MIGMIEVAEIEAAAQNVRYYDIEPFQPTIFKVTVPPIERGPSTFCGILAILRADTSYAYASSSTILASYQEQGLFSRMVGKVLQTSAHMKPTSKPSRPFGASDYQATALSQMDIWMSGAKAYSKAHRIVYACNDHIYVCPVYT